MVKYKLNFLLAGEIFIHLLFWLALLWLNAQNQVFFIAIESDVLNLNENKITNYTGVFTFYWFYLLVIPKSINRSMIAFLALSLLSLVLITKLDNMLFVYTVSNSNSESYIQLDIMYWINFLSHCFFAFSALLIQRCFTQIKQSWHIKEQKTDQTKTELALLKQQIHPHFLFNVLNSLFSSSYQYGDDKTAEGIGQLSDLLRYMLYETSSDRVPLNNELNYLNDYIKLQMLRFSEDVELKFSNSAPFNDIEIAPMLLITLVENAFKHGVMPECKNIIKISLTCEKQNIFFTVSNIVKPSTCKEKPVGGVGLVNLKRRLMLLYDNKHELTTTIKNNIFTAELVLR
ncbi:MAG: histidine kinase [Colwellia sp.]|nr:histidine kinase [Colwellia sp.]